MIDARTSVVRRIPIRIPPLPGESYASYIDRLAADIHAPISAVLYALGVIDEEKDSAIGSGYGITLKIDRMELLSTALDLPLERVQALFLAYYNGRAVDITGLDPTDRGSARKIAVREWAYFSGSHACPDCLKESNGSWQLRWKLPSSFACVQHGRLLADHCPECERRIGVARQDGSSRPRFISRIPVPGRCGNAQAAGYAATGRAAIPCGYPLWDVDTDSIANYERLSVIQSRIDAALQSDTVTSLDQSIRTLDYFRELRSLCSFLLSIVEIEDVSNAPPSVKAMVRHHIDVRDEIRADQKAAGKNWRHSSRQRHYTGAPHTASLMAGVLPTAVELLDSKSLADLTEALGEYLERFRRTSGDVNSRLKYLGFSERLRSAANDYLSRYQKTTARLGMSSTNRGTSMSITKTEFAGLTPNHIPQLFWEEDFERDLKELLIPSKALTLCSWEEAARRLELPVEQSVGLKTRLLYYMNTSGNTEEFDRRLRAILRRIAADPDRVDYRERRKVLESLVVIEWDIWRKLCQNRCVLSDAHVQRC